MSALSRGFVLGCRCSPRPCIADRVQRLKDARSEAAKEIEAYKASKDQEFKAFEASVRPVTMISFALAG